MKHILTFLLVFFIFISESNAQKERLPGKIITEYGWTYKVDNIEIATNKDEIFKVVFDVHNAPEDASKTNSWIETVARFINMHVNAGVPFENLHVALVLHGNASYGLLKNEFYKEKYSVDNPNIELIKALDKANVNVILCGQTAVHRDLTPERRIAEAKLSLSAMTVLIQLQNEGYSLISF